MHARVRDAGGYVKAACARRAHFFSASYVWYQHAADDVHCDIRKPYATLNGWYTVARMRCCTGSTSPLLFWRQLPLA